MGIVSIGVIEIGKELGITIQPKTVLDKDQFPHTHLPHQPSTK